MKVWELLDEPEKLIKDTYAKDKNDEMVGPWNPDACKWCIIGAIHKCYKFSEEINICALLRNKINENIIIWNYQNSYEEIIKILKELDI